MKDVVGLVVFAISEIVAAQARVSVAHVVIMFVHVYAERSREVFASVVEGLVV